MLTVVVPEVFVKSWWLSRSLDSVHLSFVATASCSSAY